MPNIKLHDYASNAIVELDTDAIVYRTEHSTADIPHTHLALAYNYTLDVKETPEQIDILAKGGSLDDWISNTIRCSRYANYSPVPPTRKVLVIKRGIARVDEPYKNAGKPFISSISIPVEAGSVNWSYDEIDYYDVNWKCEKTASVGTTEYKIIGY